MAAATDAAGGAAALLLMAPQVSEQALLLRGFVAVGAMCHVIQTMGCCLCAQLHHAHDAEWSQPLQPILMGTSSVLPGQCVESPLLVWRCPQAACDALSLCENPDEKSTALYVRRHVHACNSPHTRCLGNAARNL